MSSGRLKTFYPLDCRVVLRLAAILTALVLFFPAVSFSSDPEIVSISLNLESKGDFFVLPKEDGDFLIKADDLKSMGFRDPTGLSTMISGESYLSLRSMTGVVHSYNPRTLSLELSAPPHLLGKRTIDFAYQQQDTFYYPEESSAYLNYRLSYSGTDSDFTGFDLSNQFGIRRGKVLFQSDTVFTQNPSGGRFNRLMSNVTIDRRDDLLRTVVGDSRVSSGDLGGNALLGGISISKLYRIDPYFQSYPSINQAGFASSPSEVDIYLNGIKMRTEKLHPGEFELKDFYTSSGAGLVEFVVRDALGKETRITRPFYLSDRLLKKGLHEFSYNLGFIRHNFATSDDRYSKPAFSGFHRYGKSDALTVGMSAEASSDFMNAAPQVTYLLGTAGVVTASVAASAGAAGRNGLAGLAGYEYILRQYNVRALLKGFSRDYAAIGNEASFSRDYYAATGNAAALSTKKSYEMSLGFGAGGPDYGSITLGFALIGRYDRKNQSVISTNYSRKLARNLDMFANLRIAGGYEAENRFSAGISYSIGNDHMISAWADTGKDSDKEIVQIQKNVPLGEGVGYRASFERSASAADAVYSLNPSVQYNGRHGAYSADIRFENNAGSNSAVYQMTAAGALAYVGNTLALTRPINDSFAVVKVGDLEGVLVYQNSQEIGRTDASGKLVVVDLNSFIDNQISINDKDVPLEYSLSTVLKHVSPPLRSGSCLVFQVARQQPIIGRLHLEKDGTTIPLEFLEAKISVDNRVISIPTGKGGEFYLDTSQQAPHPTGTAEPGCSALEEAKKMGPQVQQLNGVIEFNGERYPFSLPLHQSADLYIDLGQVVIKGNPLSIHDQKE
jgi:outer membrane usher protein FimD/PapC